MAHRTDNIQVIAHNVNTNVAVGDELDVTFYDRYNERVQAFNVTVTDIYRHYAYESWTVRGTDRTGEVVEFAADRAHVVDLTIIAAQ